MTTRTKDKRAEQVAAVLAALREGRSLRKICAEKGMPSKAAFLDWVDGDAELADHYARARARGWDALAEKAVDDTEEVSDPQAARLLFDARRWYLGKVAPKKYGDKVALTGGDETDAPIRLERIERVVRDPSVEG